MPIGFDWDLSSEAAKFSNELSGSLMVILFPSLLIKVPLIVRPSVSCTVTIP